MNRLSYSDVRDFVENNSQCLLISKTYQKNSSPLIFQCYCGSLFETSFAKFRNRNKRQCNTCGKQAGRKTLSFSYDEVKNFIETESECKLLSKEYVNNSLPLDFLCKCRNEFATSFAKFKDRGKRQCKKCGIALRQKHFSLNYADVEQLIEDEGCTLLSATYINMKKPLLIKCGCGESFKTSLEIFQRGKTRCSKCTRKQSKYSQRVEKYLKSKKINYEKEFIFDDCRDVLPLPFDFALIDKNNDVFCLIEVDGEQHFKPVANFGGEESFKSQLKRDKIKNDYCSTNNISLIRIPYYDIDNVDNILNERLMNAHFIVQANQDNTEPSLV